MSFSYPANDGERETLREVFGEKVESVTFWDTEEGGGNYAVITGFDGDGNELRSLDPDDDDFDEVEQVARERDQTVKFSVHGIKPEPLPADEAEMVKALERVQRARDGDSNDEEIDAYFDLVEILLRRWPGHSLD